MAPPAEATVTRGKITPPNRGAKKIGRPRGATKRPWKTSRARGPAGTFSRDANQEANPKQISTGARGANMKTRRTFGAKASATSSP